MFCLTVPKNFIGEHFGVSENFCHRKFSCIRGGWGITVLSKFFVSQYRNEKLCKWTLLFSGNFLISKKKYGGEGAYHDLQSKILWLTVSKTFVRGPHTLWEKFWFQKVLWKKRWGITFFLRKGLISQCRKLSSKNPTVFEKEIVLKKFYGWKGGYHVSPLNYFGLTVPKNFVREFHCFWENFRFQKVLWMKTGVSRFPVGKFWSHSAEKFGGHPFKVSENLGYRKILCIITIFRRKFFVSQCRKLSWASVQCFRKFGVSKILMHIRDITFFRRIFFVSQCRKLSLENPSVSEKIFGFKKFYGWKRGYHVFPLESFGLTVPENLVGTPSMFQKIWVIEKFYA